MQQQQQQQVESQQQHPQQPQRQQSADLMVDLANSLTDRELVRRMSIKWRDAGRMRVREKRFGGGPTAPNSLVCSPVPVQRLLLPRQPLVAQPHVQGQQQQQQQQQHVAAVPSGVPSGPGRSLVRQASDFGRCFSSARPGFQTRHIRQMSAPMAPGLDVTDSAASAASLPQPQAPALKPPPTAITVPAAVPASAAVSPCEDIDSTVSSNSKLSAFASATACPAPTSGSSTCQGGSVEASLRHLHTPACLERPGSFSSTIDPLDLDRLSQYSLYMVRDTRFYFQHPYLRLVCAYLVVFLNFLIYAEDPIADSSQVCSIPVLGNVFAFVFRRYPPNAWSLLKVVMWLLGILVGIIAGKLCHVFLFNRMFRLKMFANDEGSWMTMWFSTIISVYVFSNIYNAFLLTLGGAASIPYLITQQMDIRNSTFMNMAATGTWLGDFMTAWMVSDMMLQEHLYPSWNRFIRQWWRSGYTRIVMFWILLLSLCTTVITVICTDSIRWDHFNRGFAPSNELSRAFLATTILSLDLLIVMQDWDFPNFTNNFDVRLPGVARAIYAFDVRIPDWFKRIVDEDVWTVHITGKWFNYGLLFVVMCLDLNMWKNQMVYSPCEFGQYVGPHGSIYSVHNESELALADCSSGNHSLTFEFRNSTLGPDGLPLITKDIWTHSRYSGYPLRVKLCSFLPSVTAFAVFGALVVIFGRYSKDSRDVYQGRMKKNRTLNNLLVSHSQARSLDKMSPHAAAGGTPASGAPSFLARPGCCKAKQQVKRPEGSSRWWSQSRLLYCCRKPRGRELQLSPVSAASSPAAGGTGGGVGSRQQMIPDAV